MIHSSVNPEYQSQVWAEDVLKEIGREYVIYGMGLGYHIQALLKADDVCKVIVLENSIELLTEAFPRFRLGKLYKTEKGTHFL